MTRDPYVWIDPWEAVEDAEELETYVMGLERFPPEPKPGVPIWLLAIIMLGIAFGVPALGGWIAAAMVDAGWVS